MKLILKVYSSDYCNCWDLHYAFECESKEKAQVELFMIAEQFRKDHADWETEKYRLGKLAFEHRKTGYDEKHVQNYHEFFKKTPEPKLKFYGHELDVHTLYEYPEDKRKILDPKYSEPEMLTPDEFWEQNQAPLT